MDLLQLTWPTWTQLVLRLLVATGLGSIVGYERARAGKPVGMRTYGMVSLGAALFTIVSLYAFGGAADPARVAAQVVTGIGFLGAGAILRQDGGVQGLTTAAGLWLTAAVGLTVGSGLILLALVTVLLVFGLLRFGPRLNEKLPGKLDDDD
jgi:putative Mg2+ transporter-C (MgtC) family protein